MFYWLKSLSGVIESMNKRTFSAAERYAVWWHHEKRCWLCEEPLRLESTTIDHFLPESLLKQPQKLATILVHWGLPEDFNINGFENWLPCHPHCNQNKGVKNLKLTPANVIVLEKLLRDAPAVRKTALKIGADAKKDKVIGLIRAALEKETIGLSDLQVLAPRQPAQAELIRLDNGYWLHKDDIARECDCQCERESCLDYVGKVHCYFSGALSDWVIQAGLYWKCYDEVVTCPRCERSHKRGYIGRAQVCEQPYRDQTRHTDED
ncbi:HNH endonuclease signature motif containing protein [Granulicella sp. L60]|uniref:HNH endonuclease signature motif containing protein n=1 Tax=Granulicella sp. L60 TaxID=1641866 RepID=UPI00131C65FD|nr:HNH endonuclease signature motif containing protein [Granulicella sp. L60]